MTDSVLPTALEAYSFVTHDKLRYADTDRQGHINNAAFVTFLETGRVEILHDPQAPLADEGSSSRSLDLAMDFHSELRWPGQVDIGLRVARVGTSSVHLHQGLFQDGQCAATAATVIVQMSLETRRAHPLLLPPPLRDSRSFGPASARAPASERPC